MTVISVVYSTNRYWVAGLFQVCLRAGVARVDRSAHKTDGAPALALKGKTDVGQTNKPHDFRQGSPPFLFLRRE